MNTKTKRRLVVVTGIIVIVLVVVLAVVGGSSSAKSVTIADMANGQYADQKVQVSGNVVENSFSTEDNVLTFDMYDPSGDQTQYLRVKYEGGVAATFGNDVTAICTGKVGADGVLHATELVTKCPSKYESAEGSITVATLLSNAGAYMGTEVKLAGYVTAGTIAGIDADDIRAAARAYASGNPSTIQWGLKVDQTVCGIPLAQALLSLGAICGDIDVPGGMMIPRCAYDIPDSYGCGMWNLSDEMLGKMLGVDTSPLHALGFDPTANGDTVLLAIETGEPYPIRMLFIQSTNPIANMAADAPRVYNAMRSVDYNVVVDVFMTPTAVACADIVLPCGMSCERNSARVWWWPLRSIVKVADYYEAKSDEQIILELGKKLNPRLFPWETDVELMTWWIQSGNRFHAGWPHKTDQTFLDLTEKVIDWPDDWAYRKHELGWLRDDGQPGFNTNTGKCELYNTLFDAWGFDPLPYYEEPPESPISTPELFEQYPLVLTTGARNWSYFHSEHRQIERLRRMHPDPIVQVHPDKLAELGMEDGEWVWIENQNGRAKIRIESTPILTDPRIVACDHAWWRPEGDPEKFFDVFEYNINNLMVYSPGKSGFGSNYKTSICRLYKLEDGE